MHRSPTRHVSTISRTMLLAAVLIAGLLGSTGSTMEALSAPARIEVTGTFGPEGMDAATAELTYRVFNELLSGGNRSASADLIAADALLLTPEGMFLGPEGFDAFVSTLRAPFTDLRFTVVDTAVYGDTVAVHWSMTGRVGGASPAVAITGSSVLRVATGRIVRHGFQYDRVELASQIERAQYTEMELARGSSPVGGMRSASADAPIAGPVAGVLEPPTPRDEVCPPCMLPW